MYSKEELEEIRIENRRINKMRQEQMKRYGRWGTCVDCPWEGGIVYPERCVNTNRYDHQLK